MKKKEIYTIGYPAKAAYLPFIKLISKYADKDDTILDIGGGEGTYSAALNERGFNSVCVDINDEYIKKAKEKGVESYIMDATSLNFPENSFDIVLLFEVLEHIKEFESVLEEAKRVGRKKILITVPNCGGFYSLKQLHLTYDHFLAMDHVNFFNKEDLEKILSKYFNKFKVEEKEPVGLGAINLPWILRYPILLMYKLKLIRSNVYYRLYSIVEVD